jgi:glutaminyl-peptide cyclotransferase
LRVLGAAVVAGAVVLWLISRDPAPERAASKWAPVVVVRVLNTFPHDPAAFTQGLIVDDGQFVEGTGLHDSSEVRRVDIASGAVRARVKLDSLYFGEGVARVGDRLYQITWREGRAFVWDRATLAPLDTLAYEGDGWGLTFDGTHLVMSDGSATLTFRDPATFAPVRTVQVTDNGMPVDRLNELEFVRGKILANIWSGERVAVINPATGVVERWLALEGLRALLPPSPGQDVLNGLAYDAATGRLYATGKRWPLVFELDPSALTAAPASQ